MLASLVSSDKYEKLPEMPFVDNLPVASLLVQSPESRSLS